MKLSQFKRIIKEEIRKVLKENRSFATSMVKDPLNVTLPKEEVAASVQDKQRIKKEIDTALTKALQDIASKYGQHLSPRSFARCSWYAEPDDQDSKGSIEIASLIQFI
jgi:hypothetical protein